MKFSESVSGHWMKKLVYYELCKRFLHTELWFDCMFCNTKHINIGTHTYSLLLLKRYLLSYFQLPLTKSWNYVIFNLLWKYLVSSKLHCDSVGVAYFINFVWFQFLNFYFFFNWTEHMKKLMLEATKQENRSKCNNHVYIS